MNVLGVEFRTVVFSLNVLERLCLKELEAAVAARDFRAVSILKPTVREISYFRALMSARVRECDSGQLGNLAGERNCGTSAGESGAGEGTEKRTAGESRSMDT